MFNPVIDTEYYIKCSSCMNHTKTTSDKVQCENCERELKRGDLEYFVYMPIGAQLIKCIENHFEEIISYRERFVEENSVITDIQDAHQFRISQKKHSKTIVLSLTVNTDGAQIFNSASKSVWPIQICLNFLPPQIRYVAKNVMLVALHSGKPNMRDFFYPLLNELKQIYDDGGIKITKKAQNFTFLPLITNCTADLPAKAAVQDMIAHNGYFACGYCAHKGNKIKKDKNSKAVIRYTRTECLDRTHNDVLQIYKKLKSIPIKGYKGISCMIAAYDFDLVYGFNIDYMHCVLLGILKKLLELWLSSENHNEPYYIPKQKQIVLSTRILNIKPICEINRRPRSIFDRKDYKANEFRTLLLFYLRYCLVDMLPMRYIEHFQLLSSSIYMLLGTEITRDNILEAEMKLKKFADDFEVLYHKHNVTMNVHLSRHLANSVRHNGPLWAQSSFAFETNNGVLIMSSFATKHFLMDMAWKYCVKKTLEAEIVENNVHVRGKSTIRISSDDRNIMHEFGYDFDKDILTIYKFFSVQNTKYSSLKANDISSIDYFVQLHSDEIGMIHYYFVFDDDAHALIQIYEEMGNSDHLKEVKPSNIKIIANVKSIKRKLMYMKIKSVCEVVAAIPNNFEKT